GARGLWSMCRARASPAQSRGGRHRRGCPGGGIGGSGVAPPDVDMERLLFIVSSERRELYENLRHVLAHEKGVDIILNRRRVKRRRREEPPAADRRRFARRSRPHEDVEIHARGWTVVRLP